MVDRAINEKVSELLQRQIDDKLQIGVQVCAYVNGERIVDTWAGRMGPDDPRPVQADTLFSSFSTTKGVAATALHVLADRGAIDYEAPVAKYWPEFAQNGKEGISVAIAMSHQAGLHAMPPSPKVEHLTDWQGGLDWIASGKPAWKPGTATGYHAITYAWVVGGIVGGATGRHIKDVIRDEIAAPLGIEDEMFVGIPDGVEDRLATLAPPDQALGDAFEVPPDHDMFKAMPRELDVMLYNTMEVRKACLPSANGHFTARALAKMYAALANGGEVDGVRLVSPERIPLMQKVLTTDMDRVIGMRLAKGVGYMMGGDSREVRSVTGPRITAFGHSGAGGSTAFADPEIGLAVGVTINQMHMTLQAEGPTFAICELIREEIGAPRPA